MANGDAAAAAFGWSPVLQTDDIRLGYDKINQLADYLASAAYAAPVLYSTRAAALAAGFQEQPNWTIVSAGFSKLGKNVSLWATVTRTGTALAAGTGSGAHGDVPNQGLLVVPDIIKPTVSNGVMGQGATGQGKSGYMTSLGYAFLVSINSDTTINVNDNLDFLLVYHL